MASIVTTDTNGYLRTMSGGSPLGGLTQQASYQPLTGRPSLKIIDPNAAQTDGSLETASMYVVRGGNYSGVPTTNAVMFLSNFQNPTSGATPYESTALLAQSVTVDSSSAADKDAVGVDARGVIYYNNLLGRAWGISAQAYTVDDPSADGRLIAIEAGVGNYAVVDQPLINTTTSKLGLNMSAAGSQHSTAAFQIVGGGAACWHKGMISQVQCLVPLATNPQAAYIELLDTSTRVFAVDSEGRICQLKSAPTSQAFGAVVSNGLTGTLTLTGTIAAGAENTSTVVSNSFVRASSQVFFSLGAGSTNAANSTVNVQVSAQSAGSFTLRLINGSATSTGACTLVIHYWVIN
jgi:hypothetical protein